MSIKRVHLSAAVLAVAVVMSVIAPLRLMAATTLPEIYAPVGGVQINTSYPTIVWDTVWPTDPLVAFKIRLATNDSPYGTLVYDSGWINGNYPVCELPYMPPKNTLLYPFVWEKHQSGSEIGWSPSGVGGFIISTSMPGPGPCSSFAAAPGDHKVTLYWRNPSSSGFTGTMIRYSTTRFPVSATDGALLIDKPGSPGANDNHVHSGIGYGVYYYSAFAHDAVPRYATQLFAVTMPVALDDVPPGLATALRAVKGPGKNVLSWRTPNDGDFAGTMIRYKTTGYPTSPTDGTLLVSKPGSLSSADSHVHSGVSPSATYYYSVFTYDGIPNYSQGVQATPAVLTQSCLRLHPANPRYFQDTATGQPVMITGYASIVPSALDYDYVSGIHNLVTNDVRYARVWHFLPWSGSNAVWPWGRSSVPGAPMGGNKINMNTWNDAYWSRMRDAMVMAHDDGLVGELHLFERCGLSPGGADRWQGNPWASDNNVNGLETPSASTNGGTPDFYYHGSKPNLRNQQERYVRKMIDETIIYPNIIYEVENEHLHAASPGWADHYAQFVKDYITANYPDSPRLISYSSIVSDADLDACFSMPAINIVNKHWGSESAGLNSYLEARWGYSKAINIDEFANGLTDPNTLRDMCWTIVTSGGNFHIEDCAPSANPYVIVGNIRQFLALSGWDFIHAAPNKNLITVGGGCCMAQPGVEYVCYFQFGGNKTITLAAGAYRAQWWNPTTGGFSNTSTITHAGGSRTLATPNYNPWVLHLEKQMEPVTNFQAIPGNELNNLSWTNPTDAGFAGVKILAKTTGYPDSPTDGTTVYTGAGASCAHSGLTNGVRYYYTAYAHDGLSNYSTGVTADATPTHFCPLNAKQCANGTDVALTVGVVSAVGTDWFYAQCPDPDCGPIGIRITKPGHGVSPGQSVGARGTAQTDPATGEKYIAAIWTAGGGSGSVLPVGMPNAALGGSDWLFSAPTGAGQQGTEGGSGANNLGLLVRVWGKVTQRDTENMLYCYIDDGSGLLDGTQTAGANNVGIRIAASPSEYPAGSYVVVTGISACFKDASGKVRPRVIPVSREVVGP